MKGLILARGNFHLKVYKKNYLWVFLSKREMFWPWLEEPTFVSPVFDNLLDERHNKLRREYIIKKIKITSNYQVYNWN